MSNRLPATPNSGHASSPQQRNNINSTNNPSTSKRWINMLLGLSMAAALAIQFVWLPLLLSNFHAEQSTSTASFDPPQSIKNQQRQSAADLFESAYTDGTFNHAPIRLVANEEKNIVSRVHCVGDNYQVDAWKERSCHFANLCFNLTSQEYVVFREAQEDLVSMYVGANEWMHASSVMQRWGNATTTKTTTTNAKVHRLSTQSVSLGGLNSKWGSDGIARLEWFPRILQSSASQRIPYYQLPPAVTLIPFHSLNGANPGHLVWDDFLPIYNLLKMFGREDSALLLMRIVLQDGLRGLWASCDLRSDKRDECDFMINKFLPLMVGPPGYAWSTNVDFQFQPKNPQAKVDLVCARHGVAGIGALTDHGVSKSHGWDARDYLTTHNHGRGALLYDFRNFMLQNLGLPVTLVDPRTHRVIFSQISSDIGNRKTDFAMQMDLVQQAFPKAHVEGYQLKTLSLERQIELAATSSIFVSMCGGAAVTAMFLPKGASVILYFTENGGVENNKRTFKPARLDWDLFNSLSHVRVHWMPRNTMKGEWDVRALLLLIQHELKIIEEGALVI